MSMLATIAKPAYDNTIKAQPTGSTYPWAASTGALDVNFGATIGDANAIQILTQGYTFAWRPDTVNVIDNKGNLTLLDNVNAGAAAQVWQNKLTYVGTTAATSDEFTVEGNRLKHAVRMVAPPQLPSGYTATPQSLAIGGDIGLTAKDWSDVELWADGASQTADFTTSGDLSFRLKSNGTELYRIPAITVVDDAGNETAGQYKFVFGAGGVVTLYMLVPWDWMQAAQYPAVIDPTVIVAGAYDTSGGGGQKIVRLSDNSIVVAVYDSSASEIIFYRSTDGGTTWAQLCYISAASAAGQYALASTVTTVYCIVAPTSATSNSFYAFDATTVTNTAQTVKSTPDTGMTAFGPGTSIAIDGNGYVQATWSIHNSQSGTWAIRKGQSTDNGATWAVSWWSTPNAYDFYDSCLVIFSNLPVIVSTMYTGAQYQLVATYNAGNSSSVIQPELPNTLGKPDQSIDGNGILHVVWHGEDANTPGTFQIKYSKSTSSTGPWDSPINLTNVAASGQHQQNAVIYADQAKNDLYVFFQGIDATISTSYDQIRMIKYTASSATWGAVTSITANTTASATDPSILWSALNMNSSDAVRVIYSDAQAGTVEYYSIAFDSPPNAPILGSVANFDATTAQTLPWTFSDPDPGDYQSAYQLQIYDPATSTTVVDTGKVASTTTSYSLAANTLANGNQYQWRVTTWDSSGEQGLYSAYATFSTAAGPSVTITTPGNNAQVSSSQLTAQWSYSDPASNAQQSFRVKLLDSTDGTVLADSGLIANSGNQYTVQYTLANGTTYHVQVTATNSKGVSSAVADNTFSTSFTPPATVTVTLNPSGPGAYIQVAVANTAPSGSEPTVSYNDVWRRNTGTVEWTRVATQVPQNGTFDDYAVASGQSYDYRATAYGNNGTSTNSAHVTTSGVTLSGTWVHDVSNPVGTLLNLPYYWNMTSMGGQTPNGEQWTPTATQLQFAGRTDPIVEFGEAETYQVTKGAMTMELSDGNWAKLSQMLRNQTTLCLRDSRGRVVFGNVLGYQEVDLVFGNQVQTLTFTQTAYSIAV